MLTEARVQVTDLVVSDGNTVTPRMGKSAALMVQDAHARYQDAVRRGNVYTACMQAIAALSVNSTTATGLIITNPIGSGKNLVFLELLVALASAPAGISVLALVGKLFGTAAVTHTTPIVAGAAGFVNALTGGAGSTATLVDTAATIPTPATLRPIGGGPVATGSVNSPFIKDQIDGALIVPPGGNISLQCFTTAISVIGALSWEEVPV